MQLAAAVLPWLQLCTTYCRLFFRLKIITQFRSYNTLSNKVTFCFEIYCWRFISLIKTSKESKEKTEKKLEEADENMPSTGQH